MVIFINFFVKFHCLQTKNHNMTALYQNPYYNEVSYKGSVLYILFYLYFVSFYWQTLIRCNIEKKVDTDEMRHIESA